MGEDGVTIAWTQERRQRRRALDVRRLRERRSSPTTRRPTSRRPSTGTWSPGCRGPGTGAEIWRAEVECEPFCGDGTVDPARRATTATPSPATAAARSASLECGNGTTEGDEQCDDGNLEPGDGCSPTVHDRGVRQRDRSTPGEECDDGNTVGPRRLRRRLPARVRQRHVLDGAEECDDGNRDSGDGCSSDCLAEVCGNGRVDAGEECDDGNT